MTDNPEQFKNWLDSVVINNYGYVEVTDSINGSDIPKSFYDMCIHYGIPVNHMITMVISDFMIRMEKGNIHYQNDVLNRIMNSNLDNKDKILEVIYG